MRKLTYAEQARLFGALAHPVRLRILDILADGEACVCHLSAALHQKQAYVSQQLARLRGVGLIADRREGLFVYYGLADAGIADLLREARQAMAHRAGRELGLQPELPHYAEEECPCPRCQTARLVSPGQTAVATAAR